MLRSDVRSDWLPAWLGLVFFSLTATTGFFLTVFFKEDLGFTGAQIGLLYALQAVTGVLAALPAGLGNDRWTSRTWVAASLLVQAVAAVLLATVQLFGVYVWVFAAWSLANWTFKMSMDVQVLKADSRRSTSQRLTRYQAWRFAGITLGTVISGHLIADMDFTANLWLTGGACLALTLAALLLSPTPIAAVRLADYRADLSDRRVWWFALWMFLFASHWGAETTCYSLFLRADLHLSYPAMGYYMSAEFLAIIVTFPLAGRWLRSGGSLPTAAVAGLLLSGLGQVGMTFQPLALSVALRALHGLGDGMMVVVLYLGIAQLFSVARLGGNAGFVQMANMLGFVVGSMVYGPLGESLGYALPLWVSGLLTVALALPLLRTARQAAAYQDPDQRATSAT